MYQTDKNFLDDNGTNQKLILITLIDFLGPNHCL